MEEKRKRGRPMKRSSPTDPRNEPTFPPDEPTPPTFKSTPPQLDFDIATLGTRTETRMVEKPVVVGKTDLGRDMITMKMRPVTVTKIQPILSLEETLSLGKQDWQPFAPKEGHWFCKVEQKGQHRRFLIPEEIYQKVKDA